MDTPESPTQSPQSPEEQEKGCSDSELLDSPDEEGRVISDNELVDDEDNGELEEEEEEDIQQLASVGRDSELEDEDEVVPEFVSDPDDDDEPIGEGGTGSGMMGPDDETILLMDGDDDPPRKSHSADDDDEEEEGEEDNEAEEEEVIDTPQSPDAEPDHGNSYSARGREPLEDGEEEEEEEDEEDNEEEEKKKESHQSPGHEPKVSAAGHKPVTVVTKEVEEGEEEEEEEEGGEDQQQYCNRVEEEEEEDEYKNRAAEEAKRRTEEDEEDARRRRRAAVAREMKEDTASASRELDEHELDYDEEVPEEPSAPPAAEDEDEEEEGKVEQGDGEHAEDKLRSIRKREKKPILPPSPRDGPSRRAGDHKGPERGRRDSFKKKDEDDGEMDEGEIDDDDLEEGEVKDPMDRKIRPRPICRFFVKGNCTWGMNCRFIHPGVNDKGNYSLITKPDLFSPNGAPPGAPHPLLPNNPWGAPPVEELPPPPPPVEPPVESAWERGLRHAKEVLKKATIRKEQEPDFEEKRFNVTIGEDEREFDKENDFFRERNYRIIRDEMDFREPIYPGEPYADPYYDYEMEALWRGGQYENFRVQYTEAPPLPYHYTERERERDPRDRNRDRDHERDHRERERRQREREREREKERLRRKEEWDRDRLKREEKDRPPRVRPPREPREKKEEDIKMKVRPEPHSPVPPPPTNRPLEPLPKKDTMTPTMRRPDEWKDPWRRSKSPRRRQPMGSPPRGRRRHRPSGSSVTMSHSS
ncbi:unnamed protein product, partial [Gadus morhua 'NCC']